MRKLAALLVAALMAAPALAQKSGGHDSHHPAALSDGEVRKVDKEAKKITIRHGEIENLDMPPMTMVFQVKDAALLDRFKSGDKVKFAAEKVGGAYTVTAIDKAQL
jgi:Cu/Ag efflux protein CusF